MKGQQVDLNSIISIGNQIIGLVPKLMALAYFACLMFLLWRVIKAALSRTAIPTMELIGMAIAFGLAIK